MSGTVQTPHPDPMVMSQTAPPQNLVIERDAIRLITPVGRLSYVHLKEPKAGPPQNGRPGELKFSSTILLNPAACGDIWKAICMLANARWPAEQAVDPANPQGPPITVNGEWMLMHRMLHSPLRNGDEAYAQAPAKHGMYRGTYSLNAGAKAKDRPVCFDANGQPCQPDLLYSGCYGRLHLSLFAFPKPGATGVPNKGIGLYLNSVQFAAPGEKLAGFDAVASGAAAFGAVPLPQQAAPQPGFGPNMGGHPGGFAAPQQQAPQGYPQQQPPGYAAPPQQAPAGGYAAPPPMQPQAPAPGYAVPPGAPAPGGHIPPMAPAGAGGWPPPNAVPPGA